MGKIENARKKYQGEMKGWDKFICAGSSEEQKENVSHIEVDNPKF